MVSKRERGYILTMSYRKEVFRSLSLVTQLGISIMVTVFMCILAGVLIDKYFGTSTLIIFLVLGMCAGGRNAYILANNVLKENVREKEEADLLKKEERFNANNKQKN